MRVNGRIPRFCAALAAGLVVFGTVQVLDASPALADGDVSVASISLGIGTSATEQISIPDDSGLIGQSTALVVLPDPALAGTGFGASVDAGDTGGSCSADSGDSGYTCQAPGAGWSAGTLDLDFDAGNSSTPVPSCGASCSFTTSVYEGDTSGAPVAAGTVTTEAEAGLKLVLTAAGGALNVSVTNSGPTQTADLSVSLSGLNGYSLSGDPACTASGSGYVCDGGDTTGAVETSESWSLTLSGSTGPISLAASAYASVYPGGAVDTLSGAASTELDWTPIPTPPPPANPTGPAAGPTQTTPSSVPTVQASASAKAKAAPGGDKALPVLASAKTAKAASASASASVSAGEASEQATAGAAAVPVAAASASAAAAAAAGSSSGGGGGGGTLIIILICVVALILLALVAWRLRAVAARRRQAADPQDPAADAVVLTANGLPARPSGARAGGPQAASPAAAPVVPTEQQIAALSAFVSRSAAAPVAAESAAQDPDTEQAVQSAPEQGFVDGDAGDEALGGAAGAAGIGIVGGADSEAEAAESAAAQPTADEPEEPESAPEPESQAATSAAELIPSVEPEAEAISSAAAVSEPDPAAEMAAEPDAVEQQVSEPEVAGSSAEPAIEPAAEPVVDPRVVDPAVPSAASPATEPHNGQSPAPATSSPAEPDDVPERNMDDTGPIDLSQFFTRAIPTDQGPPPDGHAQHDGQDATTPSGR